LPGSTITVGAPDPQTGIVPTGSGSGFGPVLSSAPAAPRSPLDPAKTASNLTTATATSAGGSNSGPRVDWPSASLPAGLLGLFLFGALLLLAVTEASPRSWQFRPFTPPA
jgi:hypothetical protein